MLETASQIEYCLNLAGERLYFEDLGVMIKGIPGTKRQSVPSFDSIYDIEQSTISFYISERDYRDKGIIDGSIFRYASQTGKINYFFKVSDGIPDFLGWICLRATYVRAEDV